MIATSGDGMEVSPMPDSPKDSLRNDVITLVLGALLTGTAAPYSLRLIAPYEETQKLRISTCGWGTAQDAEMGGAHCFPDRPYPIAFSADPKTSCNDPIDIGEELGQAELVKGKVEMTFAARQGAVTQPSFPVIKSVKAIDEHRIEICGYHMGPKTWQGSDFDVLLEYKVTKPPLILGIANVKVVSLLIAAVGSSLFTAIFFMWRQRKRYR